MNNEDSVIPPSASSFNPFDASSLNRWQDQLLPVDTVLVEEDVTVLRQELETAHQLLQYQQRLIDSLTEQLVGHEAHQSQLEQDLADAQRHSHKEAEKLKEFHSICQDLRSQLRRQQTRITALKQNSNSILPPSAGKVTSRRLISLGQAAGAVDASFTPQTSPVSPWSATAPVNLASAFAICCQKLATLNLNQAQETEVGSHTTALPPVVADDSPAPKAPDTAINKNTPSAPPIALELPSFVH